jgi:hypothetical protein
VHDPETKLSDDDIQNPNRNKEGNNSSAVPEINPGSVAAGLGLLTGGVLMMRARLRK